MEAPQLPADVRAVAASIVVFLKAQLEGDVLGSDARESVEVAVQCVETAFELRAEDAALARDLTPLVCGARVAAPTQALAVDDATRADAERSKNEGNDLMRAERFNEALDRYSHAVSLDSSNPVYFCNRAAAHYRLGAHEAAAADCGAALALRPDYSKAHGRLGLALRELGRHREARTAFARAAQLDPDNASYRENLRVAEELAGRAPPQMAGPQLAGLLQDSALLSMASDMISDPNIQNIITGLMGGQAAPAAAAAAGAAGGGAGGMGALLEAGQALAQHMQATNPDLVEALRRRLQHPPPAP